MNNDCQLRSMIADAVRAAVAELRQTLSGDTLWAFALCPDDDVRYFYHVACTAAWVREREAECPGIGSLYNEWSQTANEALFDRSNTELAFHADKAVFGESAWTAARNQRFETLVLALNDCREGGVFAKDTLLCVGTPDPSDDLAALGMRAVVRLNPPPLAERFARDLGC
jgi:hypothetical protein